ncbi:mucoidy inhibitor MuiA family protein [Corallococcus sp. M34]|uniref:mucoidy inhibitor MuiA family protein n=1 Tax=Citreicoccus inhibens TaxID=2849499 RepID=UPI001C24E115|nr:mucoidy inhibitor MuiA family protein [Citreicoccus inhibens]MBU8897444.1 mucoidy inhibitor MuiA family protein [Citreicoccus inhibens]
MHAPLSLPVSQVTLLEDRALVERRGEVTLAPGAQRLVIEGLPRVAVDRSLQARLSGGVVSQARLRRVTRPQPPEAERALRTEVERRVATLREEQARRAADVQRLVVKQGLLQSARADVYRAIAEQTGVGDAHPVTWREQLGLAREQLDAVEAQLREARQREEAATHELNQAQNAAAQALQPEPKMDTLAELEVNHPTGGATTVTLSYLVPCAAWRPAYRATLRSTENGEQVTVECEAVVWQHTGEDWKDVGLTFSTARPTLGATPPRLAEDWLWLRDKSEREKRVVDVSVREEVIQTTGEATHSRKPDTLPGMDDGGEALTLAAPHPAQVLSNGEPHRIPLMLFTAPARSELVACPEQSPLVHRVARFENVGPSVLLAGPVDLVRSSGYVGRAQLKFTGRNEHVKLGFGSEDALRIARQVEETEETRMLTSRRTRTHKVKLFVSNMGARPEALALEERIPVSEVAAVEVALVKDSAQTAPTRVSAEGIVRFELKAEPRSQQTLSFSYTVSSSAKVAGL